MFDDAVVTERTLALLSGFFGVLALLLASMDCMVSLRIRSRGDGEKSVFAWRWALDRETCSPWYCAKQRVGCGWPDAGTAGNGSCGAVDRDFSLWANAGRSGNAGLDSCRA